MQRIFSELTFDSDATDIGTPLLEVLHNKRGVCQDFDPTNNISPGQQHITLAWGRDFTDISPLRGVIHGGGHHELTVRVTVAPYEDQLLPEA